MLDEPTRGIDVGAKFEIYQLIAELAKKTKDHYYFFRNAGTAGDYRPHSGDEQRPVAGIVETKTTTQNEILRLASLHL